ADPVAVHWCFARAAGSAYRESLRHRPVRARAEHGAHDARGRAARADAQHAGADRRVQRLSLGRPHAPRCRAPSQPPACPQPAPRRMNDARLRTLLPASKGTLEGHPPLTTEWCLFLDIDGTLLEHAERPDLVVVDSPLRGLIGRLDRCLGGAIALISGRGVED